MDASYIVRLEFEQQITDYDSFKEDDIAETKKIMRDYLNLEGHGHMFLITVQFLPLFMTFSASTKNSTFKDAKDNEHKREEAMFAQEMLSRRVLGASQMFSNVNYHIQEPYDQSLFSNTNMTKGIPYLSFAESAFGVDHPAGAPRRCPLVPAVQKQFLLMTYLLSEFCLQKNIFQLLYGHWNDHTDLFVSPKTPYDFWVQSRQYLSFQSDAF